MSHNHSKIRSIGIFTGILSICFSICFSSNAFAISKKKHAKVADDSYQEDSVDNISINADQINPNEILYIPDPEKDNPAITHFHAENTSSVVVQPSSPNSTIVVQPKSTDETVVVKPTPGTGTIVVETTPTAGDLSDAGRKAEDLVRKAADYIKQNGRETGLAEINKPNGMFTNGTNYVFAMDFTGSMLADPFDHNIVGKNQFDLQDLNGKYINRDLISKAKAGGGFEVYHWQNPVTKNMDCKKTYVLPMEGYFIASGYFFPPNADGKCE